MGLGSVVVGEGGSRGVGSVLGGGGGIGLASGGGVGGAGWEVRDGVGEVYA